jgi:hypothetical protein
MKENTALSRRLRNFGSVIHQATVAKHLIDGREIVFREKGERMQNPRGRETMFPWIPVGGVDLSHTFLNQELGEYFTVAGAARTDSPEC